MREHRGFSGWKAGCALAVLAGLLAGCASRSSGPGGQAPSPALDEQAPVVGVVMREFEFEPRPLKAKAGVVRFQLMNRGTVEHDFAIPALAAHEEHERHLLKPGETRVVEVELKPGTYEAICTIPGHKEAGMVVTIEVSS